MLVLIKEFEELAPPQLWRHKEKQFWVVWGEKGCLCVDGDVWVGCHINDGIDISADDHHFNTLEDAYMAAVAYYTKHSKIYPYMMSDNRRKVFSMFGNQVVASLDGDYCWNAEEPVGIEQEVMEFI